MNLREVVGNIGLRARQDDARANGALTYSERVLACKEAGLQLRMTYDDMLTVRGAVGRMPPNPNTFRARLGARLVRLVQRMLFWYTPQIVRFHNAATLFAEHVCSANNVEIAALQQLYDQLDGLKTELRLRTGSVERRMSGPASPEIRDAASDCLASELRARLEQRAGHRGALNEIKDMLVSAGPPAGPWLELECGRGDLLSALADTGYGVTGIEPNRFDAAHCRSFGHAIVEADPLRFFEGAPNGEYAAIAARSVFERHETGYALQLVNQAARALAEGGLLLVTGANPASILAGAGEFWEDPGNLRPVPMSTARAMIEHAGFRISTTKNLRPWPDEAQLPLAELELVRALNEQLYAPREYAILARRP